jgi:hypothetical protein
MDMAEMTATPPQAPLAGALDSAPTALSVVDGIERRASERGLRYWRELAAPRRYPALSDVTEEGAGELWRNMFVVELADAVEDHRFVQAGSVVCEALGRDPTGRLVAEVLPKPICTQALYRQRMAAQLGVPLDETGHWVNEAGEVVLYRAILLPLSDDQRHVHHLLGVISFRRAA